MGIFISKLCQDVISFLSNKFAENSTQNRQIEQFRFFPFYFIIVTDIKIFIRFCLNSFLQAKDISKYNRTEEISIRTLSILIRDTSRS